MDQASETGMPIQMRLGYGPPTAEVVVSLQLRGLTVKAALREGRFDDLCHYLKDVGLEPHLDDERRLCFPLVQLNKLQGLPPQVTVDPYGPMRILYALTVSSHGLELPVLLGVEPGGGLRLRWEDDQGGGEKSISANVAGALLALDLPVNISKEAWKVLDQQDQIYGAVGGAALVPGGWVEIETSKPRMLEELELPALFKRGPTTYGLPVAYAYLIDEVEGLYWRSRPGSPEKGPGPQVLSELPLELSGHHHSDLLRITDHLAANNAIALVWGSGLGRRIMALAAAEVLDAYPVLIVTPPWGVWAWQRHLELFGRSSSLLHNRADVRLVTYLDLARGNLSLPIPSTIIFDDLCGADAASSTALEGLSRLDGYRDAYRIAISTQWPDDLEEATRIMAFLRPGEFDPSPGARLLMRYPGDSEQRAAEHIGVYLEERSSDAPDTDRRAFRRSRVRVVEPSANQVRELDELHKSVEDGADPVAALGEALEIVSGGPSREVSPKITKAVALVKEAIAKDRKVAVVTSSRRAASVLRSSLLTHKAVLIDEQADVQAHLQSTGVVIVCYSKHFPDLRGVDEVIVMGYPFSTSELDLAVGAANTDSGPDVVTLLHAEGTTDDRLALFAALRRERSLVEDNSRPPTAEEAARLLIPRRI